MYGKLFSQMYDGTLVTDWRALITFQQMVILCDADGVIDMTPFAISNRTGIPIEHIEAGIEVLEKPDKYSRTPDEEGRRILRLDEHRAWGWVIVNHSKYKYLQDSDWVRAQNRDRQRRKRERDKEAVSRDVTGGHAMSRDVTRCHAMSRHTDTDTDIKTSMSKIAGDFDEDLPDESQEKPKTRKSMTRAQHDMVIDLYREILPELRQVTRSLWYDSQSAKNLKARWMASPAYQSEAFWRAYFETVKDDDWWMGRSGWEKGADLHWLVKKENFLKVCEKGGVE